MRYQRVPWLTHEPADEWNALVHRSVVEVTTIAAQTDIRDTEELMKNTL
jgi:hypothetical protein